MPRLRFLLCALLLATALGYVLWSSSVRIDRLNHVTALAAEVSASTSPRGAERQLIIPERNERSYHWLLESGQAVQTGRWRMRNVDYDNAPSGRPTSETSPYRWFLGWLARLAAPAGDSAPAPGLERAARWANPLVQVLLLVGGVIVVGRNFGGIAAVVFAIGVVAVFPAGSEFLAGMPDNYGLALGLGTLGLVGLLAALGSSAPAPFAGAAALTALAVWVCGPAALPLAVGSAIGALGWRLACRSDPGQPLRPWRAWSVTGAVAVLAAYLFEFAPDQLAQWRLDTVHPLLAIVWLGVGEVLHYFETRPHSNPPRGWAAALPPILGALAVTTVAGIAWSQGVFTFLTTNPDLAQLSRIQSSGAATNFLQWASGRAANGIFWASLAPLLMVPLAIWVAGRKETSATTRSQLVIGLIAVTVALVFADGHLRATAALDATLVILGCIIAGQWENISRSARAILISVVALTATLGIVQLWPEPWRPNTPITGHEAEQIIERDLAQWLAMHSSEPRPVVYAPPHQTLTFAYYGNLRGLGTLSPDNHNGLGTSVMLAGATSMEAAQALIDAHQVRYLVVPSWDPFFTNFARDYLGGAAANRPSLLISELRRLNLPLWLRPVAYQPPPIGGFEHQWVLVFEVVPEQTPVVAVSRLAEFLVESGDLDRAAAVAPALRKYPGNVGALTALAQVQLAHADSADPAETINTVASLVRVGGDRNLPWDRRVSLAIVLARGDHLELARSQVQRCLAAATEVRLRTLNTGALYQLLVVAHAFELQLPNNLQQLALTLLPANVRASL